MSRFARDVRGGIMITFALVFPVMLLGIGSAIDYGQLYSKRTTLQAAADASALTAANELKLANRVKSDVEAIAKASAMANLKDMPGTVGFSVEVSEDPSSVTVELTQSPGMYFMDTLMGYRDTMIKARATAMVAGETPICMLILEEKRNSALKVNRAARITGNECAVYSNSVSSSGINVHSAGQLAAELICSAGGADGGTDSFKPGPLTDCPTMADPLARRMPPVVGRCSEWNMKVGRGTRTLQPGTYCGGLSIGGDAIVKLNPGVYVMYGGPLSISGKAIVRGKYVGFYLTGRNGTFSMGPNTTIELSAPKDGSMTGILFFGDRKAHRSPKHSIRSNAARSLVGTFYLPRGSLIIDATKPLFDKSAYTIIIARTLDMFSGPDLILNSNYEESDIPIPTELDEATTPGDQIVLVK
jgi:Flp pilus assembly protein TadG